MLCVLFFLKMQSNHTLTLTVKVYFLVIQFFQANFHFIPILPRVG